MNPEYLAPVEHRMSYLGKDPLTPDMRVRCTCGWTEKTHYFPSGITNNKLWNERARRKLYIRWERHVYTPEQLNLLEELGHERA